MLQFLADTAPVVTPVVFTPDLGVAILRMLVFAIVGILLMALGFKVFDWMTPNIDVQKELAERHNMAVAIVIGAVILGVSAIVTVAMI